MTDITFYAHKNEKWIKRKTLKEPLVSELYDTIGELDEKYKVKHWAIPSEHNPEDYPELLDMEKIALKHINHYRNDFYLHDIHAYLKGDREGIWLLRDTGTHYIQLGDTFDPEYFSVYKSYVNANKIFYLIKEGKITKIGYAKAMDLIEKKSVLAA